MRPEAQNPPPEHLSGVSALHHYEVVIGTGLWETCGPFLAPLLEGRPRGNLIMIADRAVEANHLPRLRSGLATRGWTAREHLITAGEERKSFAALTELCETLSAPGLERSCLILVAGGGVIGDLAGFAAAILLRGLDYVHLPTTLLAQVDSALGGKTGINLTSGKNLVGAFHAPRLVLSDLSCLVSLPAREMRAGYAEIAKIALIGDASFFVWLEKEAAAALAGCPQRLHEMVVRAAAAKLAIVAEDEHEKDTRALLNFGHSFGHALEAELGYDGRLLHGEAVAVGLCWACDLAAQLGLCPTTLPSRVTQHVKEMGLPTSRAQLPEHAWSATAVYAHMRRDKKNRDGELRLVLPETLGRCSAHQRIDAQVICSFLERCFEEHR